MSVNEALGSPSHQALIAHVVALFGSRAVIVLTGADSADVVLDSREELSVRWHPLRTTSPNIGATVRGRRRKPVRCRPATSAPGAAPS